MAFDSRCYFRMLLHCVAVDRIIAQGISVYVLLYLCYMKVHHSASHLIPLRYNPLHYSTLDCILGFGLHSLYSYIGVYVNLHLDFICWSYLFMMITFDSLLCLTPSGVAILVYWYTRAFWIAFTYPCSLSDACKCQCTYTQCQHMSILYMYTHIESQDGAMHNGWFLNMDLPVLVFMVFMSWLSHNESNDE